MSTYCQTTPLGDFYGVTDVPIIHDLRHYIMRDTCSSEQEYSDLANKIVKEYSDFVKDIRRVAVEDMKIKKSILSYDDCQVAYVLLSDITDKNIEDYYRNAMIAILKVLDNIQKKDIERFTDNKVIEHDLFIGTASFLHQVLFQILEFTESVATYKEGKDYNRSHSRKQLLSFEIMGMARNLPRHQICYNDIIQNMESIFLIRQAIEVRTQELLGIKCVWDKVNDQEIKIAPDAFIQLLNNVAVHLPDTLSTNIIKKIHVWTNMFVHTGNSYYQWQTEFFWEVIAKFIFDEVVISKEYMLQIPILAKSAVIEDKRDNCEIIMSGNYYKEYGKE